jgi:hypothetical protein
MPQWYWGPYAISDNLVYIMSIYNRALQILDTRSPRQLILFGGFQYLWVLSIALASCHPSGIHNFNIAPRFLEYLCTPDVKVHWLISCSGMVYLIKHHTWRHAGSMQHTSSRIISVCTLPQEKELLGPLGLAADVMCLLMSCTSQVVI